MKNKINKFINTIMLIIITIFSLFSPLTDVKADSSYTGKINGNGVILRELANENSQKLASFSKGTTINVLDADKSEGTNGCNDGWYHVSHNGIEGYICAAYLIVKDASYGRPWTSPKKAIYGGAAFISSDYISLGQDSLYLQRYNVNPSGFYSVNNHQYATDLRYASNQAQMIYNKYADKGLLSSAFNFEIPIFNNMPDYTSHPIDGQNIGGTSNVIDKIFESQLASQGFPESYRVWLRSIHVNHPNWTFTSICTGLDFNDTVDIQTKTAKINISNAWVSTTSDYTAYYLDPRNFLDEKNILMFSQLSYDSKFDSTVSSLLKGTFMAGNDSVDNESYASFFTGAGKAYNINPVYLAAKAIIENSRDGSSQTSGNAIDFDGITYTGFYNFFSIGASDSKKTGGGVAYAAAETTSGNIGGNPTIVNTGSSSKYTSKNVCSASSYVNSTSDSNSSNQISALNLKLSNNFVTNINIGETASELLNKNSSITIKNNNGNIISGNEKIGTGYTISLGSDSYKAVVYGDVLGDGNVNTADVLKLLRYIAGEETLDDSSKLAADTYRDSTVNTADALKILKYVSGEEQIAQN